MSATKRRAAAVPAPRREVRKASESRLFGFGTALPLPLIPLVFALLAALLGFSDDSFGESASKRGDGIVEIMLDAGPGELDDVWPDTSPDVPYFETVGLGVVGSNEGFSLPNRVVSVPRSEVGLGSRLLWRGRGFVRGPPTLG